MDNIKNVRLSSIILKDEIINSLIGFHAFTRNDYISSFHRKRKAACSRAAPNSKARLQHFEMTGIYLLTF